MNNVLITGANGQLGISLQSIAENYPNYTCFFATKSVLDISDFNAVSNFVNENKINIIINCAAYTAVDKAEDEFGLATEINHLAVENLAEVSKKYTIKLIHISTDYVFDGYSKIPYLETATTNPTNNYGKSKLEGENALLKVNPENSVIIRTSWLYSLHGTNFVKTMLRLFKSNKTVKVVSDQIGSPTNANDLANFLFTIIPSIKNKEVETYHYSNKGTCSWFQFAQEIAKITNSECTIVPILSKDFNSKVKRPKYSLLNTDKVQQVFKVEILSWQDSLKQCLNKIK
ncbi:dTDP-4-dehydrorhamnose reductase [Lutibacter sp. A64]|uniref:dTDP-4-dehydrorhamnose reductase n=1 Tax=Lutibacter sp. A64 TaxID=2918526 RepID=UPI001F06E497|nr:dTDP-4-dehydrorhamnose reductase [Lutibacter sp. A64]UMB53685.1 dTDP-4-dehydrorhamnose reductase [Lutibacter sp. A64]